MKIYDVKKSKKEIAEETAELLKKYTGEWKQIPTVVPFKYRKGRK